MGAGKECFQLVNDGLLPLVVIERAELIDYKENQP